MRVAPQILLSEQERTELESLAAAADSTPRLAQRARIILLAASGEQNKEIAPRLGIGRAQVARWRERYALTGLTGILQDLPRGAPPVKVDLARLVALAGQRHNGSTRSWSTRRLATELGVSAASVSRHWRATGLAGAGTSEPRNPRTHDFSGSAPEIVGVYMAPPEHALVLSSDQGDAAEAVSDAGMQQGMQQGMRAPPAHQRGLGASLLTALQVPAVFEAGAFTAGNACATARHAGWLAFLRELEAVTPVGKTLRVIADNHASHHHAEVQQWLRQHPRIRVELAAGGAGWLRAVQRMLRDAQAGRPDCGFPAGIPEVVAAIEAATQAGASMPYSWLRRAPLAAPDASPAAVPGAGEGAQHCAAPHDNTTQAKGLAVTTEAAGRTIWPIASAKVLPPRGARQLMPREALMARLLDARRQRCVVIQGQAGSGKTSTMIAWRKAMISLGYDVCWLSLAVEDNEPARFFDCLLASIAEADVAAVREASLVVAGDCDEAAIELWVITLVQALARRQRELVLIIDDLDHLTDARILQALQWLLDYAPPQLHLALSSRSALVLSLERLRLQGTLAEFDMRDLRFAPQESERFLREQLGGIDSDVAATLHALTDGWVAGLQLLAIDLRSRQDTQYLPAQVRDVRAFTSYFEREVLVRLAPADLDMLTRVAICQRVCAPLCAAVLGDPRAVAQLKARLCQLVADNLFITVIGSHDRETWYRIHPLLREALLNRLAAQGEDAARALHATAWRWFDARGEIDDAVFHAVRAGDVDAAAGMVQACARTLLERGELVQLAGLLRQLPLDEVRRRFGLHTVLAYVQLYSRDFDALRRSLEQMESQQATMDPCERYSLRLLRAGLALQLDDTDAAAALLPDLWEPPANADDFARYARGNVVSWLLTTRGEYDLARGVLEETHLPAEAPRNGQLARCIHAISLAREGRLRHACKIVGEVMEEAERFGAAYVGLACMAAGLLADALYELDETEAACQLLAPRIGVLERVSLPEVVLRAHMVLSNAHWLAGRRAQALASLDRLDAYAGRYGLDRLQAESLALRLRRHLQQGEMERATVALEQVQAIAARNAGGGRQRAAITAAVAARAHIEMALHTKDYAAAVERAQLLAASPHGAQALCAASLSLQLAMARMGLGEAQAARKDFAQAMRHGHRLGLTRTLLDAAGGVAGALAAFVGEDIADPVLGFYIRRLLAGTGSAGAAPGPSPRAAPAGPIDALSEREREILDLLAQAMSNKKIARVLNVSAETVKWHLKNIYAKLGVSGRGGAAARLRDLAAPATGVARA
ncbi:serine/threonine protein kinase [Cupriavidus lacunae]|uniref:Serine/threonine protein kinase n=2 Tax=Cupriavidus lacunae TaxID=2666307 RepID=A0A370NHY0_9BURK|nr:serine/threonine protein kinase [Cupriavidus lacunae]